MLPWQPFLSFLGIFLCSNFLAWWTQRCATQIPFKEGLDSAQWQEVRTARVGVLRGHLQLQRALLAGAALIQ